MEAFETSLSGVPLIRVVGDVDHYTSPVLEAPVQKALTSDSDAILFDFSACPYLDSGGVAVLLNALRSVRGKRWLGVIGASSNLLRIFEIVGLTRDSSFRSFADEEAASATLAEKRG